MSTPSSSGTEKPGSSKKGVSPARNVIGLVVLVAVAAVAWFEFSAKNGYNAAVEALDKRSQDETKSLAPLSEAEVLISRSPDGPDSDFQESGRVFMKRTYTWKGLIKSYTLTAFYTKDKAPALHHFVTEGTAYVSEPATPTPPPGGAAASGPASAPGKMQPAFAPVPGQGKGAAKPSADAPKPEDAKPSADTPKPADAPAPKPADAPAPKPADAPAPKPADAPAPKPAEAPAPDAAKKPN